eukprot:3943459-Prymnesium_polylepis.1
MLRGGGDRVPDSGHVCWHGAVSGKRCGVYTELRPSLAAEEGEPSSWLGWRGISVMRRGVPTGLRGSIAAGESGSRSQCWDGMPFSGDVACIRRCAAHLRQKRAGFSSRASDDMTAAAPVCARHASTSSMLPIPPFAIT